MVLLELFGQRRKKGKASSLLSLAMVCVELRWNMRGTLCMGVAWGVL
jgi:hypothetical protein